MPHPQYRTHISSLLEYRVLVTDTQTASVSVSEYSIQKRTFPTLHADAACRRCMPTLHADAACRRCMPPLHADTACRHCMRGSLVTLLDLEIGDCLTISTSMIKTNKLVLVKTETNTSGNWSVYQHSASLDLTDWVQRKRVPAKPGWL